MALRAIVLVFAATALIGAGSAAMANFLVMQKSPATREPPPPAFCAGKKDQDYCTDSHTLTRCKAGVGVMRMFCPSGCSALLAGSAQCNAPATGN
jgi:hypothetical protein